MKSIKIYTTFKFEKAGRFPTRFKEKEIFVGYDIKNETIDHWRHNRYFSGARNLLIYLEKEFGNLDFQLILVETTTQKENFVLNKEKKEVLLNYPKWSGYLKELENLLDNYKLKKYWIELYKKCREEGTNNFFSNIEAKEVSKELDNTIFKVIEKMFKEFDNLTEGEQQALLTNVKDSKVETLILKKYEKLDKRFKSKNIITHLAELKNLPVNLQATLISNLDKAAHLLFLYNELETSLNEFEELIEERRKSKNKKERLIHAFLAKNYWLLGIEYFNQVIKTDINSKMEKTGETYHRQWRIYPDFEILKSTNSVDTCVVIELEEANDQIFTKKNKLSKGVLDGLFQAITYSVFLNIEKRISTKGIVVIGGLDEMTTTKKKKLIELQKMFTNIKILTYNDLIDNAKKTLDFLKEYKKK